MESLIIYDLDPGSSDESDSECDNGSENESDNDESNYLLFIVIFSQIK